jgi:DNA-binding response OmpR family regulator
MLVTARTSATIVAVDPCLSDYDRLARDARQAGMRWYQFSAAQEALRAAPWLAVDLWIINLQLPDMSGLELIDQLQPRRRGGAVFLVADAYTAEDERRALKLGVLRYVSKPAQSAWLRDWRPPAARSGHQQAREGCHITQ